MLGWGNDLGSVGLSEEAVALDNGVKRQVVNLLKAVRLVMRSTFGCALVAVHARFPPNVVWAMLLFWGRFSRVGRAVCQRALSVCSPPYPVSSGLVSFLQNSVLTCLCRFWSFATPV